MDDDDIKKNNYLKSIDILSNEMNDTQVSVKNLNFTATEKDSLFNPYANSFHITDQVKQSLGLPELEADNLNETKDTS